ncbi:MAG: hydrogenase expression/formation protein HypE [Actinomycetota bacterium]|nr:hydrogenase expression/formation protein HypE [Actinomycetota bacterium]
MQLSHGDGGLKTSQLIHDLILDYLGNSTLNKMEDSAIIETGGSRLAFTTDSFVVNPIFFPGGDIGKLSICGTVNDLATTGCTALGLSFSLIMEEGFPIKHLKRILASIKTTCREAGVNIITGDTKVVEKGSVDKIFINTSGLGIIKPGLSLSPEKIKAGDKIIINGPIGDHGISILSQREEFNFKSNIVSDCAPLNSMVDEIISTSGRIHALRDATRGGLATVLLEMADTSNHSMDIYSKNIKVTNEVKGICDFLGLDPLYIANEGKMVMFVDAEDADTVLETIRQNKYGQGASIIGEVGPKGSSSVILNTEIGTRRMLDMQYGEQLPRIC